MTHHRFASKVISWYRKHGRFDLPWQKNKTAYRVWVSEIMLQQTQVSTVIPYYQKFMRRFPSLRSLADAPEDDVLAHWSGLGYYARARNLHKAAQLIRDNHAGKFPLELDQIILLPGIGRSTAGAILSFANNIPATILDGNVKRVLCRYQAIDGWPGKAAVLQQLWRIAEEYTPNDHIAEYNQAMMDLGATICTRSKPKCQACPVAAQCQALLQNQIARYPNPKPKKDYPIRQSNMLLIFDQQRRLLLCKRPPTGIWGGLWCFPECEPASDLIQFCNDHYAIKVNVVSHEKMIINHKFSHFQLNINVIQLAVVKTINNMIMEDSEQIWYKLSDSLPGGIAAATAKILQYLTSKETSTCHE